MAGLGQFLWLIVSLCVVLGCGLGTANMSLFRPAPMDPLRGEYGFLTQFSGITEADARARVREMVDHFGILEFQFYDAFEGYSEPPTEQQTFWKCACFGKLVNRSILKAYVDEIRNYGGRSWFYVQAMGTNPNDFAAQAAGGQNGSLGKHMVDGRPLLDVVVPTAVWASAIAPKWALFVASLGFSGIHWDTLGNMYGAGNQVAYDLLGFLHTARPLLEEFGLAQTCNFVDGFGWTSSLYPGPGVGWAGHTIAFPYWEVWTLPGQEDLFFKEVAPHGGGVFACYPGKTADHVGESQNKFELGIWPFDVMLKRWQKSRCHGNAYLAIGDGYHHIQSEYFPDTTKVTEDDREKIRVAVFSNCSVQALMSVQSVRPTSQPVTTRLTTVRPTAEKLTIVVTQAPYGDNANSISWLLVLAAGMLASFVLGWYVSNASLVMEYVHAFLAHLRNRRPYSQPNSMGSGAAMLPKDDH